MRGWKPTTSSRCRPDRTAPARRVRRSGVVLMAGPVFCTRRGERLVHGECRVERWRSIAKSRVRTFGVVVNAPALDHDLRFPQAVEDLASEAFVAKFAVEGFAVSILPRRTWFDVQAFRPQPRQPLTQDLGDHLRA